MKSYYALYTTALVYYNFYTYFFIWNLQLIK